MQSSSGSGSSALDTHTAVQRQLAALRQQRAQLAAASDRTELGLQQDPGQVAARLAMTLEQAAAEQQQRRAQRAAAAARPSRETTSFAEQMAKLSRGSQAWTDRSSKLGEGLKKAISDRRVATVEYEKRRTELVAARAQVADAQCELRAQERKLADAAAGVDAALKSDIPAPWLQPAPQMRGHRATAAIVCTLRAAPPSSVQTFISHHLALGFSQLYLFFDDPDDPAMDVALAAAAGGSVTPIVRNAALEAEQRVRCSLHSKLSAAIPTEIMARQQLNCETAAQRAVTAGIDWLLHIDVDEAFCLPTPAGPEKFSAMDAGMDRTEEVPAGESGTARPKPVELHFGSMDPSLCHVAYLNHEAVPERVSREAAADYFEEHTLFRRNPHCIAGFWEILDKAQRALPTVSSTVAGQGSATQHAGAADHLQPTEETVGAAGAGTTPSADPKVEAAVRFWIDRTVRQLGAPSFFLAYVNGKSAVRLQPTHSHVFRPSSVHRWEGQPKKCAYFDPARACVLHFVNCGLAPFRTKYEMLSECTTSDWYMALPLYARARDAAANDKRRPQDEAKGGRDESPSEIEALYRELVVLEDKEQVAVQLEAGVCVRVGLAQ